jgi:uncharacterized protein (TIRG00374 family)
MRWLLSASFLLLSFWTLWSDPEPIRRLSTIGPGTVVAMFCLVVVNQFLMAVRLSVAFEQCGARVPLRTWFRLTSVGQFLNLFVPQLGTVYRAFALKREYAVSYVTYASGLLAYVWLDLLMGFFIALLAIAAFDASVAFGGVPAVVWLLVITAGLFLSPLVAVAVTRRLKLGDGFAARARSKAYALLDTTHRALQSPRLLGRVFVVNVFSAAGQVATLWLSFHAVGSAMSWSALLVFQVFTKLSNQVTVTPGNLGLNELAFGVFSRALGQGMEHGVAVALLIRAVGTLTQVVLGALLGGASLLLSSRGELESARNQRAEELAEDA